jgi:hypothetical protein
MLVVIDPEQRVPKGHPLRRIKEFGGIGEEVVDPDFHAADDNQSERIAGCGRVGTRFALVYRQFAPRTELLA